jgi:methylglyoxal reductase
LDRGIEKDLIPICKENNITLQAYSPLEQGLLSGCLGRDYVPQGAQCNKKWFQKDNMLKAIEMMEAWKPLCEKYNCSIANLALAWVLSQGDFISLLSGATSVDQIAQNVKSSEIELSSADVQLMREMAKAIDK